MKKQFLSFLILLSFVFSVSAQRAQQAKSDASENNLRTHVAYLASDKLEGRRTGETGATFAAGYVANMFANYKLKAGFKENSNGTAQTNFLQSFPFVTGVEMADAGNALNIGAGGTGGQSSSAKSGFDFKPAGFSPNADIGNTAVVFVGYGIASSELKYDNYKNQNVSDRIAIAFDGAPENDKPHSQFGRFDARAKARIAKEHGAIGLLLISRAANLADDRLAQLKYDQTLGEAALPTLVVSRQTAENILGIDETRLKTIEQGFIADAKDASGQIVSDMPNSPQGTAAFKINLVRKQADAYNVIGILEGTDPNLKNEAIVIGAHYDHLGRGGAGSLAANSTEIHHGADDNASGVAALVELAGRFANERKNKRTIIFIAFGGEEEGLLGSNFYVNNPVFPLAKTVAMINMDMVGRLKDEKLTIGGIGTASEWKNLVEFTNPKSALLNAAGNSPLDLTTQGAVENEFRRKGIVGAAVEATPTDITLRGTVPKGKMAEAVRIATEIGKRKINNQLIESSDVKPSHSDAILTAPFVLSLNEDGFGPSDHSSFYGKQIPVLFFFTGTHNDYHKPSDTADKINYDGLLKVTNFVADIVKSIDQNPKHPTYAVAKSSGMMGGRTGFNVSLGTIPNYAESSDGLILDGVREDSPAARAGLKAGDKVTRLAGKEIRNVSDYTFVLGEMKADVEYEIEVRRGADKLTLKIVPAAKK